MPDATAARQAELDGILAQAEALQKKYEGKRWDPKERETFDRLCKEGDEIQQEIASEQKWTRLQESGRQLREVPDATLPNARNHGTKGAAQETEIAGYVSVGDMVLASEAFRKFAQDNYARGHVAVIQLATALNGKNIRYGPQREPLVALSREQRKGFEAFLQTKEAKAVPTIGAGIIEPDRLARTPQVTADDRLRIRDIISTGQTSSSSVEYVREESFLAGAAETAHGEVKPEETLVYTLQSAPVRTIASHIPIQNQQLEDWPQLRSLIDGRLRYSNQRREEQQILYGNGTPPNLEGIMDVVGTQDIAANGRYVSANHTLIDVVRMGITDVFVAGYEPNAVVLHPYDWETILLEKGSDDRYVWAVVTDNNGSRIWGVRVVESVGAQSRAPADIARRELIVGDWQMGVQLLDRMDLTIQVGLVDDQFIRNMRTILAESRLALPIYAPKAFAHFTTQEES